MNRSSLSLALLGLCGLALGCDARGVSLGSEEPCVLDPRLVLAQNPNAEQLSTCAQIGENQLQNSGFEAPLIGVCHAGLFCQFPASDLDGWSTTSPEQVIELWHDLHMNVPAPQGSQFAELDATSEDTLSQDVALPPGQLMYWSFLHRGRYGVDSLELSMGPPGATVAQGVFMSDPDSWHAYSGLYRVGDSEALTRFALSSLNGGSSGNLVDAVVFAPVD
jgi:hypothetical protein